MNSKHLNLLLSIMDYAEEYGFLSESNDEDVDFFFDTRLRLTELGYVVNKHEH